MQVLLEARIALSDPFELIDSPAQAMVKLVAHLSCLGRQYILQRECKGNFAECVSRCRRIRLALS
jgi:hypothetical protein